MAARQFGYISTVTDHARKLRVRSCPSLVIFGLGLALALPVWAETPLRVMSFNLWGAGANQGLSIDQTVAVLRAADADIIGVQETRAEGDDCLPEDCPGIGGGRAAALAAALGYHHYVQARPNAANWFNAVLSRYPIRAAMPNDLGVVIDADGIVVHAFNIHATDFPYQPYQLLEIPYGSAPFLDSAGQAIAAAREARAEALELLLEDVAALDGAAVELVFGDFNEPSHRDWTARAAQAGRHPMVVAWPFTKALERAGFTDALRNVHPDEVAKPAFTWTPTTAPDDPADHHDRIDYVFVRGVRMEIESARIVGEQSPAADLVITPWPSDHRAVLVDLVLIDDN